MSFFYSLDSLLQKEIVYNIFFSYSIFLHLSQLSKEKTEGKKKRQRRVRRHLSLHFRLQEAFIQAQQALSSYRGGFQFFQQIITSLGLLSPSIEVKNQVKSLPSFYYPSIFLTKVLQTYLLTKLPRKDSRKDLYYQIRISSQYYQLTLRFPTRRKKTAVRNRRSLITSK